VVIKRGKSPCIINIKNIRIEVAAQNVEKVIDTCAAGDSFAAGYLYQRLLKHTVVHAARCGHRLASKVIQYPGAIIPLTAMPTVDC